MDTSFVTIAPNLIPFCRLRLEVVQN